MAKFFDALGLRRAGPWDKRPEPNWHRRPTRRGLVRHLVQGAVPVALAFALGAGIAYAAIQYERGTLGASLPQIVNLGPSVDRSSVRVSVLDGDTVRVGGQTYRLVGFNTPETGGQARCDRENALGRAATLRLRELVVAGDLDFEPVPCACRPGTEGTRACNYGRLCARLTAQGQDVGNVLIAEGLAHEYSCRGTGCPPRRSWCG
jgi:endonuclease YncB( thermonuclease family)